MKEVKILITIKVDNGFYTSQQEIERVNTLIKSRYGEQKVEVLKVDTYYVKILLTMDSELLFANGIINCKQDLVERVKNVLSDKFSNQRIELLEETEPKLYICDI